MAGSYSAEVWLDSYRWDALEAVLAEQGTSIEMHLQDYLVDLYREMVPTDQVREIESRIEQERQEALREAEARKVFSAFRLAQGGRSQCFETEHPVELLRAARLLRKFLQEGRERAEDFAKKIDGVVEISQERFDELMLARLDNTGRVAGVFELNFDQNVFSAVSIMDGWKSYRFSDVSAAAYHAFRKESGSEDERWRKLLDRLDGKELRQTPPSVLVGGTRRLDMSEVSFEGDISECDGKLSFYVPVNFDPDAVFGTHVATEDNDDWLNVYANYDLVSGRAEGALTVLLISGDSHESEFTYPLTGSEQEQLQEKMDAYCQNLTGMSLVDYRSELLSDGQTPEQGQQM